jgi:heme a synthase
MNGELFPGDYAGNGLWGTLAHSLAAVQFNHRLLAYVLVAFVLIFTGTALRSRHIQPEVRQIAVAVGGLTLFQVFLGVVTLMAGAPLMLSMLHQAAAAMLLAFAVALTWRARRV